MCGVRVAQLAVEGSAHGVGWEDEHLRTPVEEVVVGDLDHRGRLAAAGAVHDEHARVGQALRPAEERHGLLVRLQARLLRALPASSSSSTAAAKVSNWESAEGYVPQGAPGFNEFAREQMRRAGVPSNPCVRPPAELVPAG